MCKAILRSSTMKSLALLSCVIAMAVAYPIEYEKMDNKKLQPAMVPVSSTVIPLDDLPVHKVGFGFGLTNPNGSKTHKKAYENQHKLLTASKSSKPKAFSAAKEKEQIKIW